MIYVLAAALYIYISDYFLALVSGSPPPAIAGQTWKGWIFVLVTGLLLNGALSQWASHLGLAQHSLMLTQFGLDNAIEAVCQFDGRVRILYANKAACLLLGMPIGQVLQMAVLDLEPGLTPEQ